MPATQAAVASTRVHKPQSYYANRYNLIIYADTILLFMQTDTILFLCKSSILLPLLLLLLLSYYYANRYNLIIIIYANILIIQSYYANRHNAAAKRQGKCTARPMDASVKPSSPPTTTRLPKLALLLLDFLTKSAM